MTNARTQIYELIQEHGYESPSTLFAELLQFLSTDEIKEFIEHLQATGYFSTPDEESEEEE
jgi:SOS-response transcriptional repressor LexA